MAAAAEPEVLLLAGPNGAGKTTSSRLIVPEGMAFVNADVVARQLADEGHALAGRDVAAGRIIMAEIRRLEAERESFCVETNLAGRGFVRSILAGTSPNTLSSTVASIRGVGSTVATSTTVPPYGNRKWPARRGTRVSKGHAGARMPIWGAPNTTKVLVTAWIYDASGQV